MSDEMSKEQAIKYFQTKTAYVSGAEKQAYEIAILSIAALSAEPCSDAISFDFGNGKYSKEYSTPNYTYRKVE